MKINVKKLKNCKKIIEVKIPSERVKDTFDKVYNRLKKVASVPGYRVGNAPRDLLEKHYSETAKEEVIKRLIPESYKDILEEHKLDPMGYPDIKDVNLEMDGSFSYVASIETKPGFSIKNYKGLKLKKKKLEVKEEDINKNLESLREMNASKVPKEDSEEKEKVLPKLDDEFAKDIGFESLEKLKEEMRNNLKARLESEIRVDLEMQIINQLVDSVDFDVPESLIESEKTRLVKDAESRIAYMEAIQKKEAPDKKFEMSDKDKAELRENASKQANRQVKAFFILDKIAQIEKIDLSQEDMDSKIEEMSRQYNRPKEEIEKYLQDSNMINEIAVNIRNKKVIDLLLKEANTKEV
ncbi:MAG: trigger factor [Candidatus Omnitrophota bacterium]